MKKCVSFSFIDDTPGTELVNVCLIVEVDVTDRNKLENECAEASFVNMYGLLAKFSASPYIGQIIGLGIAQLISEDRILNS